MKKAVILFTVILLFANQILTAQVAISTNGSGPDASAMLDVRSTNKGFLPPRMTDSERDAISNPAAGLIIFNTSALTWQGWNSVAWINFDGSPCIPATPGAISGNTTFAPNATGEVYSITAVANATSYEWTVPSDAIITAGQGTTSITVTFGIEVGNVSVRSLSGCGNSNFTDLNVSCAPASPVFLGGNTVVECYATGEVYTVTAVPTATSYEWTVPSDATIVSGQGTTSITVDFGIIDANITVRASNVCGFSDYASLGIHAGPQIGDYWAGGVVFYLDPSDPCNHGLVCAVSDQGTAIWGCEGSEIPGADGHDIGDGAQNTADIIAGCATADIAARICDNLSLNGYLDWFLPSRNELSTMYTYRIQINATSTANGGSNFASGWFWTSTERSATNAYIRFFYSGNTNDYPKNNNMNVRAVRAF